MVVLCSFGWLVGLGWLGLLGLITSYSYVGLGWFLEAAQLSRAVDLHEL